MLLSELVRFKLQLLQHVDLTRLKVSGKFITDDINNLTSNIVGKDFTPQISLISAIINANISSIDAKVTEKLSVLIDEVDKLIMLSENRYTAKWSSIFVNKISLAHYKERNIVLTATDEERLLGRIRLHSDWHFPGLELNTNAGKYTSHLVGSDPLYLIDDYEENISTVKNQFNEQYQNRLRVYSRLDELPTNQFGFVVSWNYLNYKLISEVESILKEVYAILTPGGTFLFSYNNSDSYLGAVQVEQCLMTAIPKSKLLTIVGQIGYEVTETVDLTDSHISWIEVKKPGKLSTIKAHQVLGKVKEV